MLRWAGSKKKLLPTLSGFWMPHHKRYIEPFVGSACLYFYLAPCAAVLGDNNEDLIEFYEVVRESPERISRRLAHIPRTAESYYRWRAKSAHSLDRETRALRFLYLNRHCFNGIFRTNSNGDFNVPFGTKLGEPLTGAHVRLCAERLLDARLVAGDFEKTVELAQRGDLVYMDPPFAMSKRRDRGEYGSDSFSGQDIARLNDAMFALDAMGVDFVVSYGDCAESRVLAKNWNHRRVRVRRHVAGFVGDRRSAYEWLIYNFTPLCEVKPGVENA